MKPDCRVPVAQAGLFGLVACSALAGPLAEAGELVGRVADSEERPIAGVTVQAYDLQFSLYDAVTDAEGRFVLSDLPEGRYRVRAVPAYRDNVVTRWFPEGRDYCGGDPVFVEEGSSDDLDFVLPGGAEALGTLLDSAGEPVANAIVWAAGGTAETEGLASRGDVTDAAGAFVLRGLDVPAGSEEGDWLLYVQSEGYPEQFLGQVYEAESAPTFAVPRQGRREVGVHELLDGILVSGEVVGPDGPVVGADVRVYAGSQVVSVSTDAEGRYAAVGLPPGDVLSWVNADGVALTYWPDQDRPVDFLSAPEEGDVVTGVDLFPPAERVLEVPVASPDGAPVVGMQGLLYNDTRTVGRGTLTDATGTLVLDSLHPGAYTLYAYGAAVGGTNDWARDQTGAERVFEVAAGSDTVRAEPLVLPEASVFEGTVTRENGEPLYNATVVARQVLPDGTEGAAAAALTDREGRFSLPGLPSGEYRVEAGVAPLCPGDPSYVTAFWPGEVNPDWAGRFDVVDGEDRSGLDFVLPEDADRDGMGDRWEEANGLDPWRDDALEDKDGDGYTNYTEYLLGTDPSSYDDDAAPCGCGNTGAAALLLPLFGLASRRRRS